MDGWCGALRLEHKNVTYGFIHWQKTSSALWSHVPLFNKHLTPCVRMCVCACVCARRWDVCGEPHGSILLRTGTTVAAQLHLKVQSHHRRGEEKAVAARVPQRLPTGGDPAQVSTSHIHNVVAHTPVKKSETNGFTCT